MSYIILAIIVGFSVFVLYHLGRIIYYGVKSGLTQAKELEQQFGNDVIGAFNHQFGGGRDNRDVGKRSDNQG